MGTSPGGDTLDKLATFYGTPAGAIAADNPQLCFAAGQTLNIAGGPNNHTATVPAGVVAIDGARPVPAPVPDKPDAPDYAKLLLQHNFSMLGYEVLGQPGLRRQRPGASRRPHHQTRRGQEPGQAARAPGAVQRRHLAVQAVGALCAPRGAGQVGGGRRFARPRAEPLPPHRRPASAHVQLAGRLRQPDAHRPRRRRLRQRAQPRPGAAGLHRRGAGRGALVAGGQRLPDYPRRGHNRASASDDPQIVIQLSFDPTRFTPDSSVSPADTTADGSQPPAWQRAAEHAASSTSGSTTS